MRQQVDDTFLSLGAGIGLISWQIYYIFFENRVKFCNQIYYFEKVANIFNDYYATLGLKKFKQEGDYDLYLDRREKNGRCFINPDGFTFPLSPAGPAEV